MKTIAARSAALAVACALLGACTTSTGGTALPESSTAGLDPATSAADTATPHAPPPGGGRVVGSAVMRVTGTAAPVTIRYRINGGPEQTEVAPTLPWERTFEARDQVSSSVSADAGAEILTCTIMMGSMLVSVKVDPRPACTFYYVE